MINRIWILIVAVMLLTGCRPAADGDPPESSDPEAHSLLELLDRTSITRAFAALEARPHTIHRSIETGRAGARSSYTSSVRLRRESADQNYARVDEESAGDSPGGFLTRLHRPSYDVPVAELPDLLLEQDPPFLDRRNRAVFVYRMEGDTLIAGTLARIVSIQRDPTEQRGRPYDSIRLFVDPDRHMLLGLDLVARQQTFFLEEVSRRSLRFQRDEDEWLPDVATFDSEARLILSPARRFSTVWDFRVGAGTDETHVAPSETES